VAHCVHLGLLAMQELYGASFCIPPHPKIVEANREVIKDTNLIFPETSSRLK
jgi:nucleoid-associated protein YgaU